MTLDRRSFLKAGLAAAVAAPVAGVQAVESETLGLGTLKKAIFSDNSVRSP